MKIRLTAHDFEITTEFDKYIGNKLSQTLKPLPRKLRAGADFQLHFTQTRSSKIKYNTCGITLTLPDAELRAKETTQHMYAAADIATADIRQQLEDYLAGQRASGVRQRLKRGLKAKWHTPGTA